MEIEVYDKYWPEERKKRMAQAIRELLDVEGIVRTGISYRRVYKPERVIVTIDGSVGDMSRVDHDRVNARVKEIEARR